MFAGECRKQKVLFAIADLVALALAFAIALALHDPDGAILAHLESADLKTQAEGSVLAGLLWVGVFRAFDLFTMRNGSRKEAVRDRQGMLDRSRPHAARPASHCTFESRASRS